MPRDACQPTRADFVIVVERKDDIRPAVAAKCPVTSGGPFDFPTEAQQRRQHATPLQRPTNSCGLKGNLQELRHRFAMLHAIRQQS